MIWWPYLLIAWQTDLALAWLDGWLSAPRHRPRLEPEVARAMATRRTPA